MVDTLSNHLWCLLDTLFAKPRLCAGARICCDSSERVLLFLKVERRRRNFLSRYRYTWPRHRIKVWMNELMTDWKVISSITKRNYRGESHGYLHAPRCVVVSKSDNAQFFKCWCWTFLCSNIQIWYKIPWFCQRVDYQIAGFLGFLKHWKRINISLKYF